MLLPSQEDINTIVARLLGLPSIQSNDRIIEELGAESADVLNLIATIEDKYSVKIRESELVKIRTPSDIFQLVCMKLK